MSPLDWIPVGIAEWGAETFVAFIMLMILTERLVGRSRLTEKNEEIALWRSKSERETAINEKNSEAIKNFADAALLKEEVRAAVNDMASYRRSQQEAAPEQKSPEGSDAQ